MPRFINFDETWTGLYLNGQEGDGWYDFPGAYGLDWSIWTEDRLMGSRDFPLSDLLAVVTETTAYGKIHDNEIRAVLVRGDNERAAVVAKAIDQSMRSKTVFIWESVPSDTSAFAALGFTHFVSRRELRREIGRVTGLAVPW